jgi:hypothetical protein
MGVATQSQLVGSSDKGCRASATQGQNHVRSRGQTTCSIPWRLCLAEKLTPNGHTRGCPKNEQWRR